MIVAKLFQFLMKHLITQIAKIYVCLTTFCSQCTNSAFIDWCSEERYYSQQCDPFPWQVLLIKTQQVTELSFKWSCVTQLIMFENHFKKTRWISVRLRT